MKCKDITRPTFFDGIKFKSAKDKNAVMNDLFFNGQAFHKTNRDGLTEHAPINEAIFDA